jgi:hypothetical protein
MSEAATGHFGAAAIAAALVKAGDTLPNCPDRLAIA